MCSTWILPNATKVSRRCPAEVGWGNNMEVRVADHPSNDNTARLSFLYNAITSQEGFTSVQSWVLFPIWENNLTLCKVAEIVGQILLSSHWFDGGLNCSWAGAMEEVTAGKSNREPYRGSP